MVRTDEMISDPPERHFALELGMTENLPTDSVTSSVGNYDLSRRDVDHTVREASLEFGMK